MFWKGAILPDCVGFAFLFLDNLFSDLYNNRCIVCFDAGFALKAGRDRRREQEEKYEKMFGFDPGTGLCAVPAAG